MNIIINSHILSNHYHDACADNLPDGLSMDEQRDFLNAYDGCTFE